MISALSSVQREQGKDSPLGRRAVSSQAGPFKDNAHSKTTRSYSFHVCFLGHIYDVAISNLCTWES